MAYKIKKKIKLFCIQRKIKSLQEQKNQVVENYIYSNPSQAARADNIESTVCPDLFKKIDFKIRALKRLVRKIKR